MSCLWMCLSLLYAATFLQSSASSNYDVPKPLVSLKCNKTVEAVAGEMVTLYCTISYLEQHCKGLCYLWRDTHGDIPCNSDLMKYSCEWDNLTYVSLTISNVVKEENYIVSIRTDCGTAESSAIRVQVKQQSNSTHGKPRSIHDFEEPTKPHLTPAVLGVFTTLIVSGLLFFLFGTQRGREIIKRLMTQEDPSNVDTASESDCLTNSEICV